MRNVAKWHLTELHTATKVDIRLFGAPYYLFLCFSALAMNLWFQTDALWYAAINLRTIPCMNQ
jgi:hypothetical protein